MVLRIDATGQFAHQAAKPYRMTSSSFYDGQDAAENARDGAGVSYGGCAQESCRLAGQKCTPVQLMGSVIGAVSQTTLQNPSAIWRMVLMQ